MRVRGWSLVLLVAARSAGAHIVMIPDSRCALDPVEIVAPATGVAATVASPTAADEFVIHWDTGARQAQFTGVPPRTFTAAGVPGTFALPSIFAATFTHAGDLMASVPVFLSMSGSTVAVPLTLTTGLWAAGGTVVEGAPIGPPPDGSFTLVGVTAGSGLGAPFGPGMLSVRLGCHADPRPDPDQFAGQTTPLSASLIGQTMRFRAIFVPADIAAPNFAGTPAILRGTIGDAVVATADLPAGLAPRGHNLFVGRSADGRAAIGVRTLHRSGQTSFLMAVRIQGATAPPVATASVPGEVIYEVGGFVSRASLVFRANRRGTRLRFP